MKKIKLWFKLYWLHIFISFILFMLAIAFVIIVSFGIKAFTNLESFYKTQSLSSMGFSVFMMFFHVTLFVLFSSGFHYWMYMGGGLSALGQKRIKPGNVNVKFTDIIGMDDVKKDLWEVVELIKDRAFVKRAGGKIIKGVILMGPPGVGKTYLAKAVATETRLPFLSTSGSDFKGIFVGIGANKVKSLFKQARNYSELYGGCIIFIDEIDVIAGPRSTDISGGAGHDHNATINQLLTELDGLNATRSNNENIFVLAATNFHTSELDQALMRPGRFDRKIYINLPGLEERKKLLKYYLGKISYDRENIDIDKLVRLLVGKSPADIVNITRESYLIAARRKGTKVLLDDIHKANERITLGNKSKINLNKKDKLTAAYHEAGKILITYLLVPTQDVFMASIVPRHSGKGVTWIMEKEERYLLDKEELLGQIKILLGGYMAEKCKFGNTSTAVEKDLENANDLALKMVTEWGMGSSGPLAISSNSILHLNNIASQDKETLINLCLNEVNMILQKEKKLLKEIAELLIEKEELDYDSLEEIFIKNGKSRLTYSDKTKEKDNTGITWDDIIGMKEPKEQAKEIVNIMKDRIESDKKGGNVIKGIMLFGPPGCGKTYLVSAIANESGLPLISRAGSDFVEKYVGVGASRVRQLFQEAREIAVSKGGCVIFIDEIDAVAAKRTEDGGNSERNTTVNQFLVEMDGVKEKGSEYNILVIGATNMSEGYLDSALLRPGRFDRKIYVSLPTMEERTEVLTYYLTKIDYSKEKVDIEKLSRLLVGMSPAEISNLVKEASLIAAKHRKKEADMDDFRSAHERVMLGDRLTIKITDEEKRETAYHEAGHCIITYLLVPTRDVFKLSIIPRKNTLGVSVSYAKEERFSQNKEEILGAIKSALGGYVAEKIIFGTSTSGVSNDLQVVKNYAHAMVTGYGMGMSGPLGILSGEAAKQDVEKIISDCLNHVNEILRRERPLLEDLAETLLLKEELDYDSLEEIFNKHGKDRLTYSSQKFEKKEKLTTWDDVIGMMDAKEEAKEIVGLLKDRVELKTSGGNFIKGLLLFGPPGCGKTYLASAIANECGVPMITRAGSDFVEKYVGVGASRVRFMFQEAREKALSENGCILFIDEIDAVAAKRSDEKVGGNSERNSTVNQFLVEMDGIKEKGNEYNIIVIGATNMSEDFLDPALLRPGRFDRKIYVDLPTFEDRKELFNYYLKDKKYNKEEIDPEKFAGITTGWSPAEISNLIQESSLLQARNKATQIGIKEIEEARERIELGLKRRINITNEDKLNTAIHEAGHCLLTHILHPDNPPFKLSIIPRKSTLGVSWQTSKKDETNYDKEKLLSKIKISLGGYAAEKIKCKSTSAGVDNDFSNAMQIAHNMVWKWGMGPSGMIGNFHVVKGISGSLRAKLEEETQTILQSCLKDANSILTKNMKIFDKLIDELMKKEELNYTELNEIFEK